MLTKEDLLLDGWNQEVIVISDTDNYKEYHKQINGYHYTLIPSSEYAKSQGENVEYYAGTNLYNWILQIDNHFGASYFVAIA